MESGSMENTRLEHRETGKTHNAKGRLVSRGRCVAFRCAELEGACFTVLKLYLKRKRKGSKSESSSLYQNTRKTIEN